MPLLARNTKLPVKKSHDLSTTRDNQTELEVAIFQGDSQKASECEYLGTVRVGSLPAKPRGAVRLLVEFALSAECILSVTATNQDNGEVTEVQFATLDTPESLKAKLQLAPQAMPKGARPIDVTSAPAKPSGPKAPPLPMKLPPGMMEGGAKKPGFIGKLFGKK
jgi:molecular chaperone DnaK